MPDDQSDLPPNDRTAPMPEQKHTVVEHKRMGEDEKKEGGLSAHFKKHWVIYTIGIGGATLIVAIIALNNQNQGSGGLFPSSQTDTSGYGSGVNVPQGGFSSSSSDSLLQGLVSQESVNSNILAQIAQGLGVSTASGGTSNPSTSSQSSNSNNTTTSNNSNNNKTASSSNSSTNTNNSNWVKPDPIGTAGESTNAWFYTVKPGDTLQSIVNQFASGWNQNTQGKTGAQFAYGYRNNAAVLQSAGVNLNNAGTAKLPAGLKISL